MSVIDILTGKVRASEAEKQRTQADLRDAVRKAREAIDAAVAKKEQESRKAAHAAGG
jgi:hypothetical protein